MDADLKEKIDSLKGLGNVKSFFINHDIETFSKETLRHLCIKLAEINGSVNLDAFFNMAYKTLESKESKRNYFISLTVSISLAIASLLVSIFKD